MESTAKKKHITVETTVNAPVEKVWESFTKPEHIMKWNQASEDWHSPKAENDLRVGGKFSYTMAAKDGSFSFDFGGEYDDVKENEIIEYTLGDGRQAVVSFIPEDDKTRIVETFEAENTHSEEMQRGGWQAILDSFRRYTEELK